jgi:Zn-dependent metalloprotease
MRLTPLQKPALSTAKVPAKKSARTRKLATPPNAGLAGFAMSSPAPTLAPTALRARGRAPAARSMASAASFSLPRLDKESAARHHLDAALANRSVKKFVRPVIQADNVSSPATVSEFKCIVAEASPLTKSTMVKFRQMFNKIPVYGSLVIVELDHRNECIGINSTLGTPTGVPHIAKVAPAQAIATVAKSAKIGVAKLTQTPRLHYYFDQNSNQWHLAYIIESVSARAKKVADNEEEECLINDYVTDAHSGKLLAKLPRVSHIAKVETVTDANRRQRKITVEQLNPNRHQMRDAALNVTTHSFDFKDPSTQGHLLPGTIYENPPHPWPLEAIGAHANGSLVARFLRDVVLRNNIDNQGGEMISTVNCWDRAEGGQPARQWKNAYWNGDQMVFGQIKFPDGSFYSVASMLDIVAHEMFHGVIDYSSRLEYQTQAGALNESYSDIFGIIVTNFGKPIRQWSWEIGAGFDGPGTALRDLQDPTRFGQPAHMRQFVPSIPPYSYERNDYGHVHENSGIHNAAAYAIITSKHAGAYVFTRKNIAALFYVALTVHLSRTSQFNDSRRGILQAAHSLFRNDSPAKKAIKLDSIEAAFNGVGIKGI